MTASPHVALVLGLLMIAGCRTDSKNQPPEAPKVAATPAPAPVPAPTKTDDGSSPSGIYPVRESNQDETKLIPAEGDHVLKAQDQAGVWHMVGLLEGIGVEHMTTVGKDALRGGTHYLVQLDDAGKAALAKLTETQAGKKIAFLVGGHVQMAPNVVEVINSGKVTVPCGSKETKCIELFEKLQKK